LTDEKERLAVLEEKVRRNDDDIKAMGQKLWAVILLVIGWIGKGLFEKLGPP
jgi:hypothetical protein